MKRIVWIIVLLMEIRTGFGLFNLMNFQSATPVLRNNTKTFRNGSSG